MRILALLEANSITGTAKAVLEMAYEAAADPGPERVEVIVGNFARGSAKPDNSLTRALESAGIQHSFIHEQGRFDSSVLPQIYSLVEKNRADIVWTNSVKSHFLVHRSGVQKTASWVAFHHGYTFTDLKMRLYNQLDRISLRHADRVVTVCLPFAADLEQRRVLRRKIRVQHMPIRRFAVLAEETTNLRQEFGLAAGEHVVLSIGRLSKEKGHADLIRAFSNVQNARLVIVGDGPERPNLERRAKMLGLGQRVLFAGHRDDAKRFYGLADVFALPSYTEGTPNVLLEAMEAGVPVVSTAVGGVSELATHERTALLTKAGETEEMAAAIRKLLDSNALRNELRSRAKEVASGHAPRLYFISMREIFKEALRR